MAEVLLFYAKVINRFFASVGKHDGDTKVEVLTTSASGTHGQQEVLFLQPISRSEVEMALKQNQGLERCWIGRSAYKAPEMRWKDHD